MFLCRFRTFGSSGAYPGGTMRTFGAREAERRSRGRDEERSHRLAIADLDHPGRALFVSTLSRLDHPAPDQVLDELPDHVSVRAQNGLIELRVAHELQGRPHPPAL